VTRDPLDRLPTALRLGAAAGLCLAPMGMIWTDTPRTHVSEAPVRVFLVGAFLALALVVTRPRTFASRRIARAATVCLGVAALLAAGHRSPPSLICALAALALSAPPVWRRPPRPAVFWSSAVE
jgi:hypothetical protein